MRVLDLHEDRYRYLRPAAEHLPVVEEEPT